MNLVVVQSLLFLQLLGESGQKHNNVIMAIWKSSYWSLLILILSKWVCIGRHSEEDTISSWASICFSWLTPCFATAGAICEEDTATVTISKMLHPDHYQQKFWQLKYNRTTWRWGNKSYKQAEARWFVFFAIFKFLGVKLCFASVCKVEGCLEEKEQGGVKITV